MFSAVDEESDNTPACAGKTKCSDSKPPRSQGHPRMRGENGQKGYKGKCEQGSPPHARGRQAALPRSTGTPRITPACAGKMLLSFSASNASASSARARSACSSWPLTSNVSASGCRR